jgi:hypothetical protein
MGLEKNRFKVSAKPFNIGMIIVDPFFYPFSETTNPVMIRLMSARGIKTFHPNFMI